MKLISIVIPCYNSEATIRKVVEMVMEEFKKMDGYDCEFVLVNDGSPKDNTYGEIKKLGEQYQNVKGADVLPVQNLIENLAAASKTSSCPLSNMVAAVAFSATQYQFT